MSVPSEVDSGTAPIATQEIATEFSTPVVSASGTISSDRSGCWSKRVADDAFDGAATTQVKVARRDLHPSVTLADEERTTLMRFLQDIDVSKESLVITNPNQKDNPIVYVTEPWQQMCGFSYSEAVGKNPRLTQGSNSDPEVVRVISSALSSARACKVQLLNYRSGHADKPFWNVLSINPLVSRGRLMFYVANLQDYSYLMGKLVKLPPSQFCRMADHFQRGRRLGKHLSSLELAKPAIYESDESFPLSLANRDGAADSPSGASAFPTVKRLGWEQLTLEPEYITNRIVDAMQCIDATYELGERESESGTHFFVNAHVNDVTIRLSVTEDADGHARISSTRVSGDTFAYHDIFRQLRGMLGDAVGEPAGAAAKPSKGLSLAGGARGRFALAPMRRSSSVTPSTSEDAAAPTAPA